MTIDIANTSWGPFKATGTGGTYNSWQEDGAVSYTPFYAETFTGISGEAPAGSFTPRGDTLLSDVRAGPFGEPIILNCNVPAGDNDFGGIYRPETSWPSLSDGDRFWYCGHFYFDSAWCAGQQGLVGSKLKFVRYQWGIPGSTPYSRLTFQLSNMAPSSCSVNGPTFWGCTLENFGGDSGNQNIAFPIPVDVPRDQWVSFGFEVNMATAGYIRGWIDDTYVGQTDTNTLPNTAEDFQTVVNGDFWNDNAFVTSAYQHQSVIMSKETPTTLDSGGRPFISPATQPGDFA